METNGKKLYVSAGERGHIGKRRMVNGSRACGTSCLVRVRNGGKPTKGARRRHLMPPEPIQGLYQEKEERMSQQKRELVIERITRGKDNPQTAHSQKKREREPKTELKKRRQKHTKRGRRKNSSTDAVLLFLL